MPTELKPTTPGVEPTATPWTCFADGDANAYSFLTADKTRWVISFRLNGEQMEAKQLANIEFILRAVNNHAALAEIATWAEAAFSHLMLTPRPAKDKAEFKRRFEATQTTLRALGLR